MAKPEPKEIAAADALKFFSRQSITVQTATPVKVKGEDGVERPGYKTKDEALAADHVLAARDHGEKIVIVTIDGRRYEAAKRGRQEAAA
jgi:hypothetical protein